LDGFESVGLKKTAEFKSIVAAIWEIKVNQEELRAMLASNQEELTSKLEAKIEASYKEMRA
jgi:hypothetical protein